MTSLCETAVGQGDRRKVATRKPPPRTSLAVGWNKMLAKGSIGSVRTQVCGVVWPVTQ